MPTWAEYYRLKRSINMSDSDDVTLPDEFTHLDRLEGRAYQAALNRLTPEQLKEYEDRQ